MSITVFIFLQKQVNAEKSTNVSCYDQQKIVEMEKMLSDLSSNQTEPTETHNDSQIANQKVNINSADLNQLDTLPGVGPTRAQDIIDYRSQYGKFNSPAELQNVKGIGPATYEKLQDLIEI